MATFNEVASILGGLCAGYPRFQMHEATIEFYYRILKDIPVDLLELAALEHGRHSKWFPTAAELCDGAFQLRERAEGVPDAHDAWTEVSRSFGSHGRYRGAPDWSYPLIGKAVAALGGYTALCTSDNPVADRAHFKQAYQALQARHRSDRRLLPAAREAVRMLGRGVNEHRVD